MGLVCFAITSYLSISWICGLDWANVGLGGTVESFCVFYVTVG